MNDIFTSIVAKKSYLLWILDVFSFSFCKTRIKSIAWLIMSALPNEALESDGGRTVRNSSKLTFKRSLRSFSYTRFLL